MPTRILGLSAYYHDSAACLVENGRIVAAAQEERFTRKKHDASFPKHAVDYCLREAGSTVKQIDLVGFYEKPLVKFERLLETYVSYAPSGWKSYLTALPLWLTDKLWMSDEIAGVPVTEIGRVIRGKGILLVGPDGAKSKLKPEGWEHFRRHSLSSKPK